MEEEKKAKNVKRSDIDWEKYDKEGEKLIEKYALLEKQHEQWNKEKHDDVKVAKEVNDFIKENKLKSVTIEKK